MKKYSLAIFSLALAISAGAQTLDRSVRPKPGPPPKIELGKTESFIMPNGMRVFVVENHKVPLVSVSIQLDIKPELQGDMAGYHDIVGELLTSGTKTRGKDVLDLAIDNIGATIKADEESMFGSALKKNQNTLLDLMSDIAINADFKQKELEKIRKQSLSGLAAAKNNPDAMLKNVTQVINYGPNHPYGEVATEESVNKITLDRCRKYFSTYWRPNVAYMAIVGDVTVAEIKPLIEQYFGKWQRAEVPAAKYSIPTPGSTTRVAVASREAAVQSVFNVTYPINLEPGQPDVIKAKVANAILGGGSQGRLFLNLREAHGWTYGSYSSIEEDDLIGNFTAYAKCRNAVTDSAVFQTLAEMRRLLSEPVSNEDLQNRITYMTGNFAINLENPQTVAQYAINIERYHMPKDYYTNYLQNLAAVTPADVQNMAKKYIHPEAANIIVVGNGDEVAKKLEQFGKVEMLDNYGRPAAKKTMAPPPAGVTAEAIRRKYVDAVGGEKVISGIHDMAVVFNAEVQPGVTITFSEWKSGGKMKREVTGMGQTFQKTIYANGKATQEVRGQVKEMTPKDVALTAREADIQAVLHPEKYGTKRAVAGTDKLEGKDVYVVDVTEASGDKSTEYYDISTGYLLKETKSVETPQGPMPQVVEYKDYKEVPGAPGYKISYNMKQTVGTQVIDAKIQSVAINKGISDTVFK